MATTVLPGTKVDYTVTVNDDETEYTVVVSALFTDGVNIMPGSASYTKAISSYSAGTDVDDLLLDAKTASGL